MGCYCRSENRTHHSLHSKEWSRTAPKIAIKKHQSAFFALVQTSLCTRIRSAGKAGEKIGTEYPDLVCGQKPLLSAKPSPLPRVTGAAAPIGKNIHLTVPFLRRGFTPRFSVSAFADRVPYANIHFAYDYEPFRTICQAVHTKKAK